MDMHQALITGAFVIVALLVGYFASGGRVAKAATAAVADVKSLDTVLRQAAFTGLTDMISHLADTSTEDAAIAKNLAIKAQKRSMLLATQLHLANSVPAAAPVPQAAATQ